MNLSYGLESNVAELKHWVTQCYCVSSQVLRTVYCSCHHFLLSVGVSTASTFSKYQERRYQQIPILTELSKLLVSGIFKGEIFMVHSWCLTVVLEFTVRGLRNHNRPQKPFSAIWVSIGGIIHQSPCEETEPAPVSLLTTTLKPRWLQVECIASLFPPF